jgi:hypothetical protein
MRQRIARTLGRAAVGVLAAVIATLGPGLREVHADEDPWHPGRQSASSVEGEAKPRDDGRSEDGVYGRLDGDLFLAVGAGVELGAGARAGGVARALMFHSAGLTFGYARALSGEPELEQVLFAGVELRPLFLPRFALDLEGAGPLVDLTLDSLSIGAGACFASEDDADPQAALELSAGLGFPLFMKARGLWLEARAALRPGLDAGQGQLFLMLSWYEAIVTGLVR